MNLLAFMFCVVTAAGAGIAGAMMLSIELIIRIVEKRRGR